MKGKSKRKFTADFKLKVVLEVLKEKETLATISKRYELHPNQISDWKKLFLDQAPQLFEKPNLLQPSQSETDSAPLYEQIGRLQMELTFLKKKLTL
jgi:transposase-like protein